MSKQIEDIKFKVATLAYQSVAYGQPTYISAVTSPALTFILFS